MVNFIYLGGGYPLCTLHRVEGLYGWVGCGGYMRDSLQYYKLDQVDTSHTGQTEQERAPLVHILTLCLQRHTRTLFELYNRKKPHLREI